MDASEAGLWIPVFKVVDVFWSGAAVLAFLRILLHLQFIYLQNLGKPLLEHPIKIYSKTLKVLKTCVTCCG